MSKKTIIPKLTDHDAYNAAAEKLARVMSERDAARRAIETPQAKPTAGRISAAGVAVLESEDYASAGATEDAAAVAAQRESLWRRFRVLSSAADHQRGIVTQLETVASKELIEQHHLRDRYTEILADCKKSLTAAANAFEREREFREELHANGIAFGGSIVPMPFFKALGDPNDPNSNTSVWIRESQKEYGRL